MELFNSFLGLLDKRQDTTIVQHAWQSRGQWESGVKEKTTVSE